MNLSPGEVTRKYPSIHVANQQRRARLFCHAIDTVHFREVGFFFFLHPRFTNIFQLMTQIENFIASRFKPSQKIQVDVMSRMYRFGTNDKIETHLMFLTCSDKDVKTVTTAVTEMSKRKLLPGHSQFCCFDVHGHGEKVYRRLLNAHTTCVNDTKIASIADIYTPDLEKVLQTKQGGYTLQETYLQSKQIVIEPSNICGKFHFLAQDQNFLNKFIDKELYPRLLAFQPDTHPRLLNRGLRREDYCDDSEEYIRLLVAQTAQVEEAVKLRQTRTPLKTYAQASRIVTPAKVSPSPPGSVLKKKTQRNVSPCSPSSIQIPGKRTSHSTFPPAQDFTHPHPSSSALSTSLFPPQAPMLPPPLPPPRSSASPYPASAHTITSPGATSLIALSPLPIAPPSSCPVSHRPEQQSTSVSSLQTLPKDVIPLSPPLPVSSPPLPTLDELRSTIQEQISSHIDKLNTEWEHKLQQSIEQYDAKLQQTLNSKFQQQDENISH